MKTRIFLLILASLAAFTVLARAQWQAQPQVSTQTGPVYPVNPAYNFHSRSNYNPFQFNWATGRWDYMPYPYGSSSSQFQTEPAPPPGSAPSMPYGGQSPYPEPRASTPASGVGNPTNAAPEPKPDDSELWSSPATRPAQSSPPKIVKFEGQITAIKAVSLAEEQFPHLLLRLRNDAGATGTADVGQRMMLPAAIFGPGVKGHITVTGPLGILDGHMVLFANQITIGSETIDINRPENLPQ